jgi:quinol monooxygenase YgiN
MTALTIIATITVKDDCIELVKKEMLKLIETTRAEEGCISYLLHQDNENSALFTFYETWASRELWQAHRVMPHMVKYRAATEGAIASFTVNELSKIA